MLKFKKVYIDSSYKVNGTSSDFIIDLPETVQLEDNMLCQIHEVSIPHSWYSIQKGVNDRLFIDVEHTGVSPWTTRARITLTEGNYNISELAGHLQTIMNNYFNDPEFPPQRADTFAVSHSNTLNKIQISINYNDTQFQILPDDRILNFHDWFPDINGTEDIHSINRILGNFTLTTSSFNSPYISGFIDLQRVKSLYLHCNEISNFNQLTVAGNSSIVKKIAVNVPYLGVINDLELSNFDYVDVSGKMLRRLNFRLTDHLNQVVNLNGVDISFTLTFFRGS